jgi:hypothetical protein
MISAESPFKSIIADITQTAEKGSQNYLEDPSVFNEWCAETIVKLGSHITEPLVTVQVLCELTKALQLADFQ